MSRWSHDGCMPVQCLQYKTDQQSDLKKVEKLNNLFFSLMAASSHADAAGEAGAPAEATAYHLHASGTWLWDLVSAACRVATFQVTLTHNFGACRALRRSRQYSGWRQRHSHGGRCPSCKLAAEAERQQQPCLHKSHPAEPVILTTRQEQPETKRVRRV